MDFVQLLAFLETIPTYGWVIIGFIVLFLFGDKKQWEYEVEFPLQAGIGHGEIEIECFKKRGMTIEAEMSLEPPHHGKEVHVFVNSQLALTIPASRNSSSFFICKEKYTLEKPNKGDPVVVKTGNETLFSGLLLVD